MKKKVAVIGANSFLARNLIQVMIKEQHNWELKLYGKEKEHLDGLGNYTCVNVLDRISVSNIDMNCDIIYFFVGKTGTDAAFESYESYVGINEIALLNVMTEYVTQNSKAKLVFPSSRLIYKGKKGLLVEEDETEGKSIYAINKLACERYLQLYHMVYGVNYLILRVCIPYGTLVSGGYSYGTMGFMLNYACGNRNIRLYGEGESRRTLTHVEDLSYAFLYAAVSSECINGIYNVGGENYSLKEMAELIAAKYKVGIEYVPWPEMAARMESGDTVFDSHKLDEKITYRRNNFQNWLDSI